MNTKVLAIAVVAILIVGVGAALVMSGALDKDDDKEINLVAQVNTEGSEIFVRESLEGPFYTKDGQGNVTFIKEAWEGKIFLTPGPATIQHTMMKQIVVGMGLEFVFHEEGKAVPPNSVAYVAKAFNLHEWEKGMADGGIIWQPVCQDIVQNANTVPAKVMIKTSEFAKDHACCVVAANHKFTKGNGDTVTAFLAAYLKATDWVNDPANRDDLVTFSMGKTGKSKTVVEAALDDVKYLNGGSDPNAPLKTLKGDTAKLVTDLKAVGGILKKDLSDLGFEGENAPRDFAERCIQDEYLSKAMKDPDFKVDGKGITVCVITGDIHQIALHVGIDKGIFAEHGINVNVVEADNGSGVATSLQNGACDVGLLGLPPITITIINGSLITA